MTGSSEARAAASAPPARLLTVLVALGALTGLGALGCEPPPPKTGLGYTADAKASYERAVDQVKDRNFMEARRGLQEVRRRYGYSKYARLAELRLADIDFEEDKLAEAARAYRQFVHDHRSDSEEVAYARAKVAESEYRQISDSFLTPAPTQRDQAAVQGAYRELRGYLQDYPSAAESPRLRTLLAEVTRLLVEHELYVARFYLRRDNYEAAVARLLYALRAYARENEDLVDHRLHDLAEPEVIVLLGETYLKMHRWADAKEAFQLLSQRDPTSPYVEQAGRYLEYLKKRGV